MASIAVRYQQVPGMTQPGPINGPTQGFTIPIAGQGGSSPPMYLMESSNYFIANSLADPATSQRQYNTDTAAYGMLATGVGALARQSQDVDFRSQYPTTSFQSFGSGGTNTSVNVGIDWDLANKQATYGTQQFWSKIYHDQLQTDPAALKKSQDYLARTNDPYSQQLSAQRTAAFDAKSVLNSSGWNQSRNYSYSAPLSYGSVRQGDTFISGGTFNNNDARNTFVQNLSDEARFKNDSYVTVTQAPVQGWSRENVNIFGGGYGSAAYSENERLAPMGSGGMFSSPTYSLRTQSRGWGGDF